MNEMKIYIITIKLNYPNENHSREFISYAVLLFCAMNCCFRCCSPVRAANDDDDTISYLILIFSHHHATICCITATTSKTEQS